MHMYIHTCTHMYIHTCTHITGGVGQRPLGVHYRWEGVQGECTHTYTCTYTHTCTCTHPPTHTHTLQEEWDKGHWEFVIDRKVYEVSAHIHTHVHTHIHAHVHTHPCTHTYTHNTTRPDDHLIKSHQGLLNYIKGTRCIHMNYRTENVTFAQLRWWAVKTDFVIDLTGAMKQYSLVE